MSPRDFIAGFISGHEGTISRRPDDNGNWYDAARFAAGLPQKRGKGALVGSMFGVTAYALVRFRMRLGWAPARAAAVTARDIAAINLKTATDIGVALYFEEPGFAKLPWNRATASVVDKGWGSGPRTAVELLQKMIGAAPDGQIGPKTVAAYTAYLTRHGEEAAARTWANVRRQYDAAVASNEGPQDPDRAFIGGWNNRTSSFLPGTSWWRAFAVKVAA